MTEKLPGALSLDERVEITQEAVAWFRDQTRERWRPLVLFFVHPLRVIGVGWRGLLLIWRD